MSGIGQNRENLNPVVCSVLHWWIRACLGGAIHIEMGQTPKTLSPALIRNPWLRHIHHLDIRDGSRAGQLTRDARHRLGDQ